ncbi:hypothetical protein NC651_038221 [Populus alba x Populus x berolinensis]|nr:hypothetical protein NC651_038221 [Populus alba x Populus x berolinensis]
MFLKNVPGEVISTRVSSAEQQGVAVNQHTAAALARICSYFETHKRFKYDLYQFQRRNCPVFVQEKFHEDGDLQKKDRMATIEESDTRRGDFQFEEISDFVYG